MTRYAVLLRGINLGRAKRVAMADLRALLDEAGFEGVATLLQSGNVVLESGKSAPRSGGRSRRRSRRAWTWTSRPSSGPPRRSAR